MTVSPLLLSVTSPALTVVVTARLPPMVSGADCVTSPLEVSDTLPVAASAPEKLTAPAAVTVRFPVTVEAPMSAPAASVTWTLSPFSTSVPKVLPALLSVMLWVPAFKDTGALPKAHPAVPS